PKARILEDTGKKVVVAVYDTEGKKVEEVRTITSRQQKGEALKSFRALNALTAPAESLKPEIGDKTSALIDEANRELEKNGYKLANGEDYPRIRKLPEIVS